MLAVGERSTCRVYATEPWNVTGLYLEPGTYEFEAHGEWLDGSRSVGPVGTRHARTLPHVLDLAGALTSWLPGRLPGDGLAGADDGASLVFGSRRVEDQRWMALLGTVAARDVDDLGVQRPYAPFLIGDGACHVVKEGGYLYAFANDAWGFYGDNRGSVTLTVTRLD